MKIINGYVCECTTDAQLAKRGIDPDNPKQDPVKQRELDEKRGKIDLRELNEAKGATSSAVVNSVNRQGDAASIRLDPKSRSGPAIEGVGGRQADAPSAVRGDDARHPNEDARERGPAADGLGRVLDLLV